MSLSIYILIDSSMYFTPHSGVAQAPRAPHMHRAVQACSAVHSTRYQCEVSFRISVKYECSCCLQNPAADIAAQLSAALSLSSKVAKEHGTAEDMAEAVEWEAKAVAALAYANRMVDEFTLEGSTCTESSAANNCVGSTCTEVDPDDGSVTEGVRLTHACIVSSTIFRWSTMWQPSHLCSSHASSLYPDWLCPGSSGAHVRLQSSYCVVCRHGRLF